MESINFLINSRSESIILLDSPQLNTYRRIKLNQNKKMKLQFRIATIAIAIVASIVIISCADAEVCEGISERHCKFCCADNRMFAKSWKPCECIVWDEFRKLAEQHGSADLFNFGARNVLPVA